MQVQKVTPTARQLSLDLVVDATTPRGAVTPIAVVSQQNKGIILPRRSSDPDWDQLDEKDARRDSGYS